MKKVLIFCIVIIGISSLLLYSISYHERNDCSQIEKIYLTSSNKYIVCDNEYSIKRVQNKLSKINFYHSKTEQLQEPPEYTIAIQYKNGSRKYIDISSIYAMAYKRTNDGEFLEKAANFYYVNPLDVYLLFKNSD